MKAGDPLSPFYVCAYCNTAHARGARTCSACGAPLEDGHVAGQPFLCEGYVVWPVEDIISGRVDFAFYAGLELLEVISVSRAMRRVWDQVFPPGMDTFNETVFKLFELARAERGATLVYRAQDTRVYFELGN